MEEKKNLIRNGEAECACHYRATPRTEHELRQLQNRLKRIIGQLSGISRMLDDNRYCGDILMQVAAVESALQAFGYSLLQSHLQTCVTEDIQKGKQQVMDEVMELIRKLK